MRDDDIPMMTWFTSRSEANCVETRDGALADCLGVADPAGLILVRCQSAVKFDLHNSVQMELLLPLFCLGNSLSKA